MRFKSLDDLNADIQRKLLPLLPRDISAVFGIPRSGMLPAAIVATALGARLGTACGEASFGSRQKHKVLPEGGRYLLIDDSIHTGKAMRAARASACLGRPFDYTCAVYVHSDCVREVDFYAEVIDEKRIFQWNFTGIAASKEFCWDMDGVICTDPTVYDDDGDVYAQHLLNDLKPLYLPQVVAKGIITNRLERWRGVTESWLRRYGIQYGTLVMQPWSTAAERRERSVSAEFKAQHFQRLGGSVFIESADSQARLIAALSNRPVLSIESMRLFGGGDHHVESVSNAATSAHVERKRMPGHNVSDEPK